MYFVNFANPLCAGRVIDGVEDESPDGDYHSIDDGGDDDEIVGFEGVVGLVQVGEGVVDVEGGILEEWEGVEWKADEYFEYFGMVAIT